MIGRRTIGHIGTRDEAEKPFWISFADLMTAMMVLFLVALSAALLQAQRETAKAKAEKERAEAIQQELAKAKEELERRERERDTRREKRIAEVKAFLDEVDKIVRRHEGVVLDRERHVISFGPRAQFLSDSHDLKLEQANALRRLVPDLVAAVQREIEAGQRWLKRVVVEGFADETGSYLHNLNLSLNRSQSVLCVLLAKEWTVQGPAPRRTAPAVADWSGTTGGLLQGLQPSPGVQQRRAKLEPISETDERLIRALFFVGGYSSNSQKSSREESRRIELRIEFFQLDDEKPPLAEIKGEAGRCALGGR